MHAIGGSHDAIDTDAWSDVKLVEIFASRPRLLGGIAAGCLTAVILYLVPVHRLPSTRAILSWDAAALWFVGSSLIGMSGRDGMAIRRRAAQQDEGRGFILTLVLVACAASLGAIAIELSLAKGETGLEKGLRILITFCTVALSWMMVQLVFAFHYAHEFYTDLDGTRCQEGLAFPGGDQEPDYWDFLHFAVIIGVAAQTADIAFTSKGLRRIGTVHSLVAFTFNTVVLALTINLLAGLF